jgi:acetoin utilization protein AcuB
MQVKDIMTWNVISVSSDTPIMEARKIMESHKILRLPVVDRGKLMGIVTLNRIVGVGPSPATSLSIWEINYLLAKMKVK